VEDTAEEESSLLGGEEYLEYEATSEEDVGRDMDIGKQGKEEMKAKTRLAARRCVFALLWMGLFGKSSREEGRGNSVVYHGKTENQY
jgi:hypothetical protein